MVRSPNKFRNFTDLNKIRGRYFVPQIDLRHAFAGLGKGPRQIIVANASEVVGYYPMPRRVFFVTVNGNARTATTIG